MNEDDNRNFDLFGLSDINKIQNDIERDLHNKDNPTQVNKQEEAPPILFMESAGNAFGPVPAVGNISKPVRGTSWTKTAVIVFLICTLGTGTLGFGLGTGFGRFHNVGGEDPGSTERLFETASFVFETVEEVARIGNLADMVELIVPSIVTITTHRSDSSNLPNLTHASGIIFGEDDERIFIATSWSVVREAERWDVSINGSDPVPAFPVGSEREADLAVAGIYKSTLLERGIGSVVIAAFGESSEMRVGDVVLAIGNAMGDGISVTRGIISATEDYFVLPGRDMFPPLKVLQTDAAINMGSSGGALINMRGEVVGININHASNIFGSSPVEGMGYSISSSFAAPILNRMAFNPFPAIGIEGRTVDAETADRLDIPMLGALVLRVFPDRAAYFAGIMPGDIITGFNGLPVFEFEDLRGRVRASRVGDVVELNILRDGTSILKQVELMYTTIENF